MSLAKRLRRSQVRLENLRAVSHRDLLYLMRGADPGHIRCHALVDLEGSVVIVPCRGVAQNKQRPRIVNSHKLMTLSTAAI
jgi:predicted RNase H-like nuclease (RuvC/YqgF family)